MDKPAPPIATLAIVAEDRYHIPRGDLLSDASYQPLVSVRHLVMLLAHEAGAPHTSTARVFNRDEKSVRYGIDEARRHTKAGRGWWLYGKADLFDAWQDALERSQ